MRDYILKRKVEPKDCNVRSADRGKNQSNNYKEKNKETTAPTEFNAKSGGDNNLQQETEILKEKNSGVKDSIEMGQRSFHVKEGVHFGEPKQGPETGGGPMQLKMDPSVKGALYTGFSMTDVELKLKGVVGENNDEKRRASAGSLPNSWSRKTREGQEVPAAIQKAEPHGKRKKTREYGRGKRRYCGEKRAEYW
jgi:hypothetical protein